MLYLVGGVSRSGKSTLAARMLVRRGVPWFPLDALKMGLHLGAPSLNIDPGEDDMQTADQIWPIVEGLLDHMVFDGRDYLVEGVNLRPKQVAAFIADTDYPVRACFLGYADVAIEAKAAQLSGYAGLPNDWLDRTGRENVRRYLAVSRALSARLRDECEASGLPYLDTGGDFDLGLELVERALSGGVGRAG